MICDHEKGVPFAGTLFFLHDGRSSVICSVEVNFPVEKKQYGKAMAQSRTVKVQA
jgi:hypothetical protein